MKLVCLKYDNLMTLLCMLCIAAAEERFVCGKPLQQNQRKEEEDMYGRGRRIWKAVILAMAILLMVAISAVGSYLFFYAHAEEYECAVESRQVPEPLAADPVDVSGGDIVLLEEVRRTPLIVIDPGHGGEDEGCSRGAVKEKEINLQLALQLADRLQEFGYDTMLTREDDETSITLEERVNMAEECGADIYISIHQNACEESESAVAGIETWYCGSAIGSRRLAQLVHMEAVDGSGAQDRELRESEDLYVIRETSMPSCLVETAFLSNEEERQLICDAEYQEKLVCGIAQGIEYYFHPKTMYLTFDDGPSEENTSAVLDILKENNIKATFFVVGENVRKHPEVAKRIVEEGHTIGIHCNSHEYGKIYASVDSYLEDFQEALDAVYEVTGAEVQLFRFPGGSINAYNMDVYEDIITEMTDRGYIYFDWNASLEDAVLKSDPEQLIENARESTLGRRKVVMLAHDIVYNTTLCLQDLIDSFPEYRMEPLTPEVAPIQF